MLPEHRLMEAIIFVRSENNELWEEIKECESAN